MIINRLQAVGNTEDKVNAIIAYLDELQRVLEHELNNIGDANINTEDISGVIKVIKERL